MRALYLCLVDSSTWFGLILLKFDAGLEPLLVSGARSITIHSVFQFPSPRSVCGLEFRMQAVFLSILCSYFSTGLSGRALRFRGQRNRSLKETARCSLCHTVVARKAKSVLNREEKLGRVVTRIGPNRITNRIESCCTRREIFIIIQ